jgi:tripeptidyl-peptidase-1
LITQSGNNLLQYCLTNDGAKRTMFVPSFPATCPFVTTVGETQGISREVAMQQSSGGFSAYFSRPQYQCSLCGMSTSSHHCLTDSVLVDHSVQTYLNAWGSKYSTYFEKWGRAFPDLSSQGKSWIFLGIHLVFSPTVSLYPSFRQSDLAVR